MWERVVTVDVDVCVGGGGVVDIGKMAARADAIARRLYPGEIYAVNEYYLRLQICRGR